jgi:hypothetical protein
MSVVGTAVKLENGARLFAQPVYMYAREFGQLALLTVSPVHNSLTPFFLLLQQPGDGLLTLFSVVRIASSRNKTYPVWLEAFFFSKNLLTC